MLEKCLMAGWTGQLRNGKRQPNVSSAGPVSSGSLGHSLLGERSLGEASRWPGPCLLGSEALYSSYYSHGFAWTWTSVSSFVKWALQDPFHWVVVNVRESLVPDSGDSFTSLWLALALFSGKATV